MAPDEQTTNADHGGTKDPHAAVPAKPWHSPEVQVMNYSAILEFPGSALDGGVQSS